MVRKINQGKSFTLHHYTKTIFKKEATFNRRFRLAEYFAPLIGDKKKVKIADLGAGMWSTTGSTWEGVNVQVYPSDYLADEYRKIQEEYKIEPMFFIDQQNMERLTYGDEVFDIVHCVNALDHVKNPFKALKEMYRVCKTGGWIYLRHYYKTATKQKHQGMHDWDILLTTDGDCLFKGKDCFLLSECLPGFVNQGKKYEVPEQPYRMIVSILRK